MKLRFRIGTVKVASVQKGGKENIIRPLWLFDCIKQNQADAGMPDFLLPLEPRYASSMVDKPFIARTFFFLGTCSSPGKIRKSRSLVTSTGLWTATPVIRQLKS